MQVSLTVVHRILLITGAYPKLDQKVRQVIVLGLANFEPSRPPVLRDRFP